MKSVNHVNPILNTMPLKTLKGILYYYLKFTVITC